MTTWRWLMWTSVVLFIILIPNLGFARRASDIEQLHAGLPGHFRKTQVAIDPLYDQRSLQTSDPQVDGPVVEAFAALVVALNEYKNLRISGPEEFLAAIRKQPDYARLVDQARKVAEQARRDARTVQLTKAASGFQAALKQFRSAKHERIKPREVARVALERAVVLLEAEHPSARSAFRDALLIDASIRLRQGYDRPEAIAALEAARAKLAQDMPRPMGFDAPGNRQQYQIRVRAIGDRLEVAVFAAGGAQFAAQAIGADPGDTGNRLAAKVWACLPFGKYGRKPALDGRLSIDGGFAWFLYGESPVGLFNNLGISAHLSWLLARSIDIDVDMMATSSGRDDKANLRRDITTLRLSIAPGFVLTHRRWRFSTNMGVEFASIGQVITTTNSACKHFAPSDTIPLAICDFNEDIDRVDPSLLFGATLSIGVAFRLIDAIYLTGRVRGASYIFETSDSGLNIPIGAQIGLGYRLF